MTRRRVSNPLALAVLCCLAERPMHPYEISQTLRSRGKEQSIKLNYGSLYSVVESLQKHGLIRPGEVTRAGRRPERTVYEITEAGRDECEDWLAELLSTPVREFTSLEAGLSMMLLLPPDEVARLLEERVERLRMSLRTVDSSTAVARESGVPSLFLIEGDFRRAMLDAELAFVQQLAAGIRSDALPGVTGWRQVHDAVAAGGSFADVAQDAMATLGKEDEPVTPPGGTP